MARLYVPQHRADVPGVWIARSDTAFDQDRFEREVARMQEAGLDPAEHPINRYYAGKTRYDLAALDTLFGEQVSAGAYYKADAERFILRRLDWDQWHRVMGLVDQGALVQAQLLAARYGVAAVENSPLRLAGAVAGLLTHDDMQRLFDADAVLPSVLGDACWRYSRPLTDAEKKV